MTVLVSRSHAASTAILLVGLACASPARAQAPAPDPERRAAAQALFDEAKQLTDAHKFAEACPKLLESYKLDPAMGTKFYLARCYEAIGKLASAWSFYLEVVDDAHKEGAADKEKFANERATALKPRLPRLSITVAAGARGMAGLEIKRDGIAIGEGSWSTPIPIDLGDHVVTAKAPGHKPWEMHVDAKEEAANLRVEVPALEALVAVVDTHPPQEPPVVQEPPVSRWKTGRSIAGYAIGGAGVIGLGIGAGLGAAAMSKQKSSNAAGDCNSADVCTPAGRALRLDAINAATASTALFVVGGVLTATGVVLIAIPPSSKTPSTTGFVIGPGSASVVGRF